MPRKAYNQKLSSRDILHLIKEGKYRIDIETGEIFGRFEDTPLFTYEGNDEGHLWVRLYDQPKHRMIPVSHIVWMAGTRIPIPKTGKWEIHHQDRNVKNNSFRNLICVLRIDHEKLHKTDLKEEVPF